ncbi:MAG: phosphatase PAP2 family protein [Pseudoxanthomonas sp.]
MNDFDLAVIRLVNSYAQHSWAVDRFIGVVADNHLLKGGALSMLVWWQWFRLSPRQVDDRGQVLATLLNSCVAMALAHVLAVVLPFRQRPIHEDALHFVLPHGAVPEALSGWSSFPSDHATLFFALAAGLLFVSRPVGVLALAYTSLVIAFPRLYMGFHYATDLLAGALIGLLVVLAGNRVLMRTPLPRWLVGWSDRHPGYFYPFMFFFTYQIADNFEAIRALARAVSGMVSGQGN